jgi:hypothetical protein
MAGRSCDESGRWGELGTALKRRRALLDSRWRNRRVFAEDSRLDYRLIYDIEEVRRPNFGVTTLTAIEVAYRLKPGSITAFLEGGELDPAPDATAAGVLPAILEAIPLGRVPKRHYDSTDADYEGRTWEGRIAFAVSRGLVHEAAIWADPDEKVTHTLKRLCVAYLRWRISTRDIQSGASDR